MKASSRFPLRRMDELALRRAIPARVLPMLVAAMTFLAALALAGAVGSRSLSGRWTSGAGAIVTVQVPQPEDSAVIPANDSMPPKTSRIDAVMICLRKHRDIFSIHRLSPGELRALLAPWLGKSENFAIPLPGVIELHLSGRQPFPEEIAATLEHYAPGTITEQNSDWSRRLDAFATSLQACAALALLTVMAVGAAVVAVATHSGLSQRRHAIEIIHFMGATDGYIAGRFAKRTGMLAFAGASVGIVCACPMLVVLTHLAAPFSAAPAQVNQQLSWFLLPSSLLSGLPALLIVVTAIGWITAQITVRTWLRRLP